MIVLLLSGGMDSALVLHQIVESGEPCECLFVCYGQANYVSEIRAARRIADHYGVTLHEAVAQLPPSHFSATGEIETGRTAEDMERSEHAPLSLYPGRNAVLISMAGAYAHHAGADTVAAGFNADDRHGYPDCTARFRLAMSSALSFYGVESVSAPLEYMTKAEVVSEATAAGVPDTWSCYRDGAEQCGTCDACALSGRGHAG